MANRQYAASWAILSVVRTCFVIRFSTQISAPFLLGQVAADEAARPIFPRLEANVPQNHVSIGAARCERLTIRPEAHTVYLAGVPRKRGAKLLAGGDIPEPDGLVATA